MAGLNLKGISPGGFKTGPGKRSWETPKKGGAHYYRKIHILGTHSGRFPGSRTQRPGTGPREIPTSQEGNREKGFRILAGIPNKVPEWVLMVTLKRNSCANYELLTPHSCGYTLDLKWTAHLERARAECKLWSFWPIL